MHVPPDCPQATGALPTVTVTCFVAVPQVSVNVFVLVRLPVDLVPLPVTAPSVEMLQDAALAEVQDNVDALL